MMNLRFASFGTPGTATTRTRRFSSGSDWGCKGNFEGKAIFYRRPRVRAERLKMGDLR